MSMYGRAPSPLPQDQYAASPTTPAVAMTANQIVPGTVTYTTSTGPDGRIIYHPFKAVAAGYQTPNGIITGIQWVPADATHVLPPGAQPADPQFAASWNRGQITKEDQKALKEWQRDEEKRRKREEKEAKKARERERKAEMDTDIHRAKERDAHAAQVRERRRSFNAGSPLSGAPSGATGYPSPVSSAGNPPSPYPIYGNLSGAPAYPAVPIVPAPDSTSPYMRERRASMNASEMERQMAGLGTGGGMPPGTPLSRPQKYTVGEATARPVSGIYGMAAGGAHPTAVTVVPGGASPYPSSPHMGHSPNTRASEIAPYPGANYSSAPAVPSTPQVYPRGHILEGQPLPQQAGQSLQRPKSRATSPTPGVVPLVQQQYGVIYPGGASPRMTTAAISGAQLAAPESFSRPVNGSLQYAPFEPQKVQNLEGIRERLPRLPSSLLSHDVQEGDWTRFVQDLYLAWTGSLPVAESHSGTTPRRSKLVTDLVNLWNTSFFAVRGVEVVLMKGRERRTGPQACLEDKVLAQYDEDQDSSSSSSSSSDSDSDSDDFPYPVSFSGGAYGRPNPEILEAQRRRRDAKAVRKLRRKEKRARRKAKRARERQYSYFITYVPRPQAMGAGMPAAFSFPAGYAGSSGY